MRTSQMSLISMVENWETILRDAQQQLEKAKQMVDYQLYLDYTSANLCRLRTLMHRFTTNEDWE